jgi:transcriptional regulator of arginine metabolism
VSRSAREHAIREIVAGRVVRTQSELVEALAERGIRVTQATVSRDIRRLGLVKTSTGDGSVRYAHPDDLETPPAAGDRLRSTFREFVTSVAGGEALLAVRTPPGGAHVVASVLDAADVEGVVATVAGDDTVLVLLESEEDRDRVRERFRSWIA